MSIYYVFIVFLHLLFQCGRLAAALAREKIRAFFRAEMDAKRKIRNGRKVGDPMNGELLLCQCSVLCPCYSSFSPLKETGHFLVRRCASPSILVYLIAKGGGGGGGVRGRKVV